MDKGYLCDGCGDREPGVYCKECNAYFCKECDAYLHSETSAGAKIYSSHCREAIKAGDAKPNPDAEKVLSEKRELDKKIQDVKASYLDLSAKSAQKSKDFLDQTLGAYLKALRQAKVDAEAVIQEATARKDFLESVRSSNNSSSSSSNDEENGSEGCDSETQGALMSIARLNMTSSVEERLNATAKAIEDLAVRYSQVKFPSAESASSSSTAEPTKRTLSRILAGESDEDLIYDEHFFPHTFSVCLDFAIEHAFDAPAAKDSAQAPSVSAKLTWKAPKFLESEKKKKKVEGDEKEEEEGKLASQQQQAGYLVELRTATAVAADSHYKACYSGDGLSCTLDGLEPGACYEARITVLGPARERLPYASAPYKIAVPKKSAKSEEAATAAAAAEQKPKAKSAAKTFYAGAWAGPAGGAGGYDLVEGNLVACRNKSAPGDYVACVCDPALDTTPGVATAWTFRVEDIDPESPHFYVGLMSPKGGDDPAKGYFFCAACGALKSGALDHKDVPECPKGSVKKGAGIGFEFCSNGKAGSLLISVNRRMLSSGFYGIPLDVPLVPAVICKSGKVRIIS